MRQATSDTAPANELGPDERRDFETFVNAAQPRLSRALAAAYGFEDGRDATAEAFAYAFEHWDELQQVANLPGYLFRVAASHPGAGFL